MNAENECSVLSVPPLENGLRYHCFLAFSYVDDELVTRVCQYLESVGLKVAICKAFILGRPVIDNIRQAVEQSRRAVLLLTKSYLKSSWFDYETLLFIHNSNMHKRQFMIPVLVDLTEEEIKKTRIGVYNYLQYTGTNEDLQSIAKAVVAPDVPMSVSLPCGNVAVGLVWSFYYGYLQMILPSMRERCRKSEWYDPLRMVHKLFILIPDSGYCPQKLSDCDTDIQYVGKLAPFQANRAGTVGRDYNASVYKITATDRLEYFAACEFATPVLSMYQMAQEGLAGLNEDEKKHQILEFHNMLDQVLSHGVGSDSFKIIFFKDEGDGKAKIASLIVESIKNILAEEQDNLNANTI